MPAIEGKYGIITAENKEFHPGEPVFLLRATDKNAVETILDYARRCKMSGCTKEHCDEVTAHAERIFYWQAHHPDLVKLPD